MAIGDALMMIAYEEDDENGDDIVTIEWVSAAHATLVFRAMQNFRSGRAVHSAVSSSSSSSAPTTPPRSQSSQQEPSSAATSSDREGRREIGTASWRERGCQ